MSIERKRNTLRIKVNKYVGYEGEHGKWMKYLRKKCLKICIRGEIEFIYEGDTGETCALKNKRNPVTKKLKK